MSHDEALWDIRDTKDKKDKGGNGSMNDNLYQQNRRNHLLIGRRVAA